MLFGNRVPSFAAIAILLASFTVHAASDLQIMSISGASNATISSSKHRVTILGGMAGGECASGVDNSRTCNSCSSAVTACTHQGFCACNPNRVHSNLVLRVNLKKSKSLTGEAVAMIATPAGSMRLAPVSVANIGDFADFTWSSICAALGNSDCAALSAGVQTAAVLIGIDRNNDGLLGSNEPSVTATVKLVRPAPERYDVFGEPTRDAIAGFLPFGGENKVFIENVAGAGTFPQLAYGAKAVAFRIFVSDVSVLKASYDSAIRSFDMVLDASGKAFKSNEIKGLTNGVIYYFRAATVDEAGNVVQFVPGSLKLPESCTTHPSELCPYSAMPALPLPSP